MKALWAGAAAIGFLPAMALAEAQYDRTIEKAAAGIVATKIGEIRGGFSFNAKLTSLVAPEDPAADPSTIPNATVNAGPWQDGLAPAVELVSRSLTLF